MSIDNVFDEELDYEIDDQNEDELLLSDEEGRACEIIRLMSSASVTETSPKSETKSAKDLNVTGAVGLESALPQSETESVFLEEKDLAVTEAALPQPENKSTLLEENDLKVSEDASVKDVLLPPVYRLNSNTSTDIWKKSISIYSATINKNVTSPTNEALQLNGLKQVLTKPQRKPILAPEGVQKQESKSEKGRKKVIYHDLMELDTPQFSPTKGFGEMNGLGDVAVVNQTNSYASDLSSQFESLSTKSLSYKGENNGTSVMDLRIEKKIQPISNGSVNGFGWNNNTSAIDLRIVKKNQPISNADLNGFGSQPHVLTKKIPFIIESNAGARKVLVNPLFNGFSQRNVPDAISNVSIIRKRERSNDRNDSPYNAFTTFDLREKILKKRKTNDILLVESTTNKNDQEPSKEIPFLTDEEENYLKEIEKQKLKREEIIRQKEANRQKEGWHFN